MTGKHSKSFFGQASAIILNSSSKSDPSVFLQCIKKKPDGSWEKYSQGEGKIVSVSLEEIVLILQVLSKKAENWSTVHKYKEESTQIAFSWENGKGEKLWINIGNYSKMLTFPQIEVMRLLFKHLLQEKIEFATVSDKNGKNGASNGSNGSSKQPDPEPSSYQEYTYVQEEEVVEPPKAKPVSLPPKIPLKNCLPP